MRYNASLDCAASAQRWTGSRRAAKCGAQAELVIVSRHDDISDGVGDLVPADLGRVRARAG